MKVGFIVTIDEFGIGSIKHKYGENAFFKICDYPTPFKSGDIVLFDFAGTRPTVTAKSIKLITNETSFCRENESKFHKSEWFLVLQGNNELFLEYVKKEGTKIEKAKNERLKKYCEYISPVLCELIGHCKPAISRWTYYKPGESHDSGLKIHNYFDININSNIIEKITSEKFYYKHIFFSRNSSNQFSAFSDFNIRDGNHHLGEFKFTEKLENIFSLKDQLTIDEDRYNEDLNYRKQINMESKKIHSKHLKNLLSIISPAYLFDLFDHNINTTLEKEKKALNLNLYEWKYLDLFPEK